MARKRLIGCTINPATDHIHMDLAASLVSRYPELNETRYVAVTKSDTLSLEQSLAGPIKRLYETVADYHDMMN